jgi:hypothetical protein
MLYDVFYADKTFDRAIPLTAVVAERGARAVCVNWDGHALVHDGTAWHNEKEC